MMFLEKRKEKVKMDWDNLIIKYSNEIITSSNIDSFNCKFLEILNNNHNSNILPNTECSFNLNVLGINLKGSYIATWIGDNDYPNETCPSQIMVESINNCLME